MKKEKKRNEKNTGNGIGIECKQWYEVLSDPRRWIGIGSREYWIKFRKIWKKKIMIGKYTGRVGAYDSCMETSWISCFVKFEAFVEFFLLSFFR